MVFYIKEGNIFSIDGVTSYAHGCNCKGAMGCGIAYQFKEKFPKMYNQYKKLCDIGKFLPGDVFNYKYDNGHIYNLGTQATWKENAKFEYIELSLIKMFELAKMDQVNKIALPTIGAGLGGLDWSLVKIIIEKVSESYPNIDLYIVEKFKPDN